MWAILCGLQMALVVLSCSSLRFPQTLRLRIQLVRGGEPGVTGLWLPNLAGLPFILQCELHAEREHCIASHGVMLWFKAGTKV